MRVGALVLLVAPEAPAARVRDAATLAWAVLDSVFGDVAGDVAHRTLLVSLAGKASERGAADNEITVAADAGVEEIMATLITRVPQVFPLRADQAFTQWLGTPFVPTTRARATERTVYVQLVTAPSHAARRCLSGVLPACRSALSLDPPGDAFLTWYDAAERRAVVQTFRFYLNRTPNLELYSGCVSAGSDSACVQLLNAVPYGVIPPPLGPAPRLTLVQLALRLGGRDAYARLVSTPGRPMADRLARAARASVDSLVSVWRQETVRARPRPVAVPVLGALLALAWTGLFGACSLRSSRWRLG
jgi:hypothetical protein